MLTDKRMAEIALMAYEQPNYVIGHASMLVIIEDGHTVISVAGTNGKRDIFNDILMLPWRPRELHGRWAHLGFWRYFMKLWPIMKSEILINGLPVIFIGHSLGGTSANYGAALTVLEQYAEVANITTFGTPRCMSPAMSKLIKNIKGKRFRRKGDPIPFGGLYGYDRREQTLLDENEDGFDHPIKGYIEILSQEQEND